MGNFPLYSFLLPMPLLLPMMSRSLATGQNGQRVGGATRHGQLFISLCYNKYHRKPTVWPTVAAPHAKERILNSKLESILAQPTVASRSSCIARTQYPLSRIPYTVSPIPYPVSSVEWQQVQPGQCPCELGKHFHWFSWLDVAWFWASHSKRVENAFAARLTATATAMSAIESICQAVSLSSSPAPAPRCVCVRASACLLG